MQILKESMRNRILVSAKKEFSRNGYNRSSMRKIASGADMTVGNLYRYYKGKKQLFDAVATDEPRLMAAMEVEGKGLMKFLSRLSDEEIQKGLGR